MKPMGFRHALTAFWLVITLGTVAVAREAPPPQWQSDSRHDWELEHESDGTAEGRAGAVLRCPPGELALAAGFLPGFAGLLVLASKKLPPADQRRDPAQAS